MTARNIKQAWQAVDTSDGAGVNLKRALGSAPGLRMDPYLMLDNFSSDNPDDYIAGFPAHPHRGFETVTYIVDGHMQHKDHLGNQGDLRAGGVQWMLAGKGIIHEEMPQQENGLLRGFQIWLNLPAKDKMQPAFYKDVPAADMPWQALNDQAEIKLIAGSLAADKQELLPLADRDTQPIIADLNLKAGGGLSLNLPSAHQVLVYVFEGEAEIAGQQLKIATAATLTDGDKLEVNSATGARVLLLTGKPLNEPIAQYGPFVMNTQEEINQAINDYRTGQLTA